MTHVTKTMKVLLGATALSLGFVGTSFAQNDFTAADTTVSNSFTLDYKVSGVDQPQIETKDDPGDATDDDDPTTFKVDRLVNVTVDDAGFTGIAPGATNIGLNFTVVNDGNDTHAYFLSFSEETNGSGDDDLDTDAPTNTRPLIYFIDTDGDGILDADEDDVADEILYNAATPPVLAPDATLFVRVQQDIPITANDQERADIILLAETRDNTGAFPATIADAVAGNDQDLTENVLGDAAGPSASDAANDGNHSAENHYLIQSAELTATKTVKVISEDGTGCDNFATTATAGAYSIPGACVEYTISVENDGTVAATDISLTDVLPNELTFVDSQLNSALTGTFSEPAVVAAGTDCAAAACTVSLTAGSLAGKASVSDPAVTGSITIRAWIK